MQLMSRLIMSRLIMSRLIMSRLIMSRLIMSRLSTTTDNNPKRLVLVFLLVGLFAGLFTGLFTQAAQAVTVDALTTNDDTPEITGTLATGETLNSVTVNSVATNTPVVDASVTPNTWRAQVAVFNALNEGTYQVIATITDAGGSASTASSTLTVDSTAGAF